MLKQTQSQRLLQKLSPQQIQYLKMLEMPTILLETRIEKELEENPVLTYEEDALNIESENSYAESEENSESLSDEAFPNEPQNSNEISLEEYIYQSDEQDFRKPYYESDDEEERYERPIIQVNSMYEDLTDQLGMLELTELEYIIGKEIIGELDEDGYLRREKPQNRNEKEPIPIESIVDRLIYQYKLQVSEQQVEEVLKKIQALDPPGIAARDLRECLLIQLQKKSDFLHNPTLQTAHKIVKDYFDELIKKHYEKIIQKLNITQDAFKKAFEAIKHLNYKPGAQFDTRPLSIVPDFILTIDERQQIFIKLNKGNAPSLKLDRNYLKMLEEYQQSNYHETKEAYQFLRNKVESAKAFIEAIRQRSTTLYKIMMAIAQKQKKFFLSYGDESQLKPMILEDIAKETEMDISTVSRAVNSKYVETPFNIYPLKFFFSSSITKDSGDEVSNKEVKKVLKEIIDSENKSNPYSDEKLEKLLKSKGYDIARRTIAKYREQMGIPVARLRKEI